MKFFKWLWSLGWRIKFFKVIVKFEGFTPKEAAQIVDNATYEDWIITKATYQL